MPNKQPRCDAVLDNHGTIVLLYALSTRCKIWLETNVQEDAQWFGNGLAVEPRYIEHLVEGMRAEGLNVRSG